MNCRRQGDVTETSRTQKYQHCFFTLIPLLLLQEQTNMFLVILLIVPLLFVQVQRSRSRVRKYRNRAYFIPPLWSAGLVYRATPSQFRAGPAACCAAHIQGRKYVTCLLVFWGLSWEKYV